MYVVADVPSKQHFQNGCSKLDKVETRGCGITLKQKSSGNHVQNSKEYIVLARGEGRPLQQKGLVRPNGADGIP